MGELRGGRGGRLGQSLGGESGELVNKWSRQLNSSAEEPVGRLSSDLGREEEEAAAIALGKRAEWLLFGRRIREICPAVATENTTREWLVPTIASTGVERIGSM